MKSGSDRYKIRGLVTEPGSIGRCNAVLDLRLPCGVVDLLGTYIRRNDRTKVFGQPQSSLTVPSRTIPGKLVPVYK